MSKAQQKSNKPSPPAEKPAIKVVAENRRARHEYELLEFYEAGIELSGTEVKSMRQGKANLQDSFARVEDGQMWLYNCHVSPYDHGNRFNHDPVRKRRLLLHKKEIEKIKARMAEKGLTLVPLKMFFKRNWVKVDLALARGKHLYDKRESIAKRDNKRQLDRLVKQAR
jgi:SsrA-binding protein